MCLPTIACRIQYFDLANTGQPHRSTTISLDSPHNLHIGDSSWPSICCFMEFTHSACSCAAHTIASVYSLSLYLLRIYHGAAFPATDFSLRLLNTLNASGSSTSNNPFSPVTNFNIHSSLSLRYLSYTSTFTHSSQLISPLPPSFLA